MQCQLGQIQTSLKAINRYFSMIKVNFLCFLGEKTYLFNL